MVASSPACRLAVSRDEGLKIEYLSYRYGSAGSGYMRRGQEIQMVSGWKIGKEIGAGKRVGVKD
jgi:hypothetical protein